MSVTKEMEKELRTAAQNGDLPRVKELLGQGCRVDAADEVGDTPLLKTAYEGHTEVACFLLDSGSNVEEQDNNGWTALLTAARFGHKEFVQVLCDKYGADILHKKKDGMNAFHACALSGNVAIAQYLVEKMKGHVFDVRSDGYTALHLAAREGHVSMVEYLIGTDGFRLESTTKTGTTAVELASARGHQALVDVLVDKHGCTVDVEKVKKEMEKELRTAALEGDLPRVKELLGQGCRVDAADESSFTALLRAAYGGHSEIVRFLLDNGSSLKEETNDGWTALLLAAWKGHKELVELLDETYGADILHKKKDGVNAFHVCALSGHVAIAQYLIQKLKDHAFDVDGNGYTALHYAAREGHVSMVEYLIGTDGFRLESTTKLGDTPVELANAKGHQALVDMLVQDYGCTVGDPEKALAISFRAAATDGDIPRMEDLLQQGCPVNAQDKGGSNALHYAALNGQVGSLHFLAPKMESMLHSTTNNGSTILHAAAQEGHTEVAQILIDNYQQDRAARNNAGLTPLLMAAWKGHNGTIDVLVDRYHCSLDDVNNHGQNALHLAAMNGNVHTIRHLAPKMETLLHSTDNNGCTMLHLAARAGHAEVVQHVINDFDLDVNSRTKNGETPLQLALDEGHLNIAKVLIDNGAHSGTSGPVREAIDRGDINEAKRLLRPTGSTPSWLPHYEEAVAEQGSVSVAINRNVIMGPPAVGKSCLKHILVFNKPKEVKISTPVIDKPEVVSISADKFTVEGTSNWLPLSDEKMACSIRSTCLNRQYLVPAARPEVHPEAQRTKSIQPVEEIDQSSIANKTPSRSSRVEAAPIDGGSLHPLPSVHPTKQSAFHDAHSSLVRDLSAGLEEDLRLNGARFVHLLDTGGQPSFQDVLPLLLDMPCTYVHVFNAAQDLDLPVPITYRPDASTVVEVTPSSNTSWEMMQQSLSSVHTLAYKVSSDAGALPMAIQLPPFRTVIVGTFKDRLMKMGIAATAAAKISKRIKLLKKKPYYSHIIPSPDGQLFFLINNRLQDGVSERTQEDQASIDNLRVVLSHTNGALKTKIPIGWFHFEMVTRKVTQKFFTLAELLKYAQELKCVSSADPIREFRSLLQLFHAFGVFTFIDHTDVANTVCTDHSVFLQEVSKLLAIQFVTTPKCMAAQAFKETGILTLDEGLFNELGLRQEVDPVWLLRCLCHLGVTASLSPLDAATAKYFMPAALPSDVSQESAPGSVAPLQVAFVIEGDAFSLSQDLPRGIFTRLAVELARKKEWQVILEKNTRMAIQFQWKEMHISIIESSGYISIVPMVSIHAGFNAAELHECCSAIRSTVEAAVEASARAVLGSKFIDKATVIYGFECPCNGAHPTHLAVRSGKSIVCNISSRFQKYSKPHQVWFQHVEGAELTCHPSDPEILHLVDPTSGGEGGVSQRPSSPSPPRGPHQISAPAKNFGASSNVAGTPSSVSPPSGPVLTKVESSSSAQEVLDQFREQFIDSMYAVAVVFDLEHKGVISNGDLTMITRTLDATLQNKILHSCLRRTCDKKALARVCDMIINVEGNPKMSTFGSAMKCQLETVSVRPSSPSPPMGPRQISAQAKNVETSSTVAGTPSSSSPPRGPALTNVEASSPELPSNPCPDCDPTSPPRKKFKANFTAIPFSVSKFLNKHETEFFNVVNARFSLQRLQRRGVIAQEVARRISDAARDEDAQETLFAHLIGNANVEALLTYCDVITSANGYPKMQLLGKKMKEELQQGGT